MKIQSLEAGEASAIGVIKPLGMMDIEVSEYKNIHRRIYKEGIITYFI